MSDSVRPFREALERNDQLREAVAEKQREIERLRKAMRSAAVTLGAVQSEHRKLGFLTHETLDAVSATKCSLINMADPE